MSLDETVWDDSVFFHLIITVVALRSSVEFLTDCDFVSTFFKIWRQVSEEHEVWK